MAPRMRGSGMEPSGALPNLYPAHDGSYGINTLINTGSEAHKGRDSDAGIAPERTDDKNWAQSLKGQATQTRGMNRNLHKAIDDSHKQVEKERRDQPTASPNAPPTFRGMNASGFSAAAVSTGSSGDTSSTTSRSSVSRSGFGAKTSDGFKSKLAPHVPQYKPHNLPFAEESQDLSIPRTTRAQIPSYDPLVPTGVGQLAAPPSEYIPFYGMPQGKGSMQPVSPSRSDSPMSFTDEDRLFADAILQTPPQPANNSNTPRVATDGSGVGLQNQTWSGLTKLFDAGKQLTGRLIPSLQSNNQNQTVAGPTLGQPITQQPMVQIQQPLIQQPAFRQPPISQPVIQQTSSQQPTIPQPMVHIPQPTPQQPVIQQPVLQQPVIPQPVNQQAAVQQPSPRQTAMKQPSTNEQPMGQPAVPNPTTVQPEVAPTPATGRSESPRDTKKSPEMPSVPKRTSPKKASEAEKSKPTPTAQAQQPMNTSPSGKTNVSQQTPAVNKDAADGDGMNLPSSDLIITSIVLFAGLLFLVWTVLSAIPGDLNGIGTGMLGTNFSFPDLSVGTMWEAISSRIPEIPDSDRVFYDDSRRNPNAPKASGRTDIDYENIITNLKDSIPDTVWVQSDKNGKIKISEDFWHALKEKNKGNNIFDLDSSDLSDQLWDAIKSRLHVDDLVDKKISQSWESWLKQNEQAQRGASTGTVLKKDEFMKLFEKEAASYQREIKQELGVLKDRMKGLNQQISRLREETDATDSMSAYEINKLVDTVVSKAILNAKIDAIAQGRIKDHVNDVLANQMNLFSTGNGAAIYYGLTSPAWDHPKYPLNSKKYLDRDGYKRQPPNAALSPGMEEGECFCAGPDRKGFGQGTNNISVLLSRDIIPQHFVVQHILPGATLDPDAMPRDIEIWAYIEDVNLRKELRAFSKMQFPDTPKEQVLNEGYIKIGHFTYEKKQYGDGVQVFKISDELVRMKAFTNQILVRAINNYGADHTCFYQLKMYGDVVERPDDPSLRRWRSQNSG